MLLRKAKMSKLRRKFSFPSLLVVGLIFPTIFWSEGECRVQARIKSYGKVYSKEILKMPLVTSADTKIYKKTSNCTFVSWSDENCIIGPLSLNKDLSQSIFKKLCQQPVGKFQVARSCSLYTICQKVSLTVNQCLNLTFFDPVSHTCTNSSNYTCPNSENADQRFIESLKLKGLSSEENVPTTEIQRNKSIVHIESKSLEEENVEKSDNQTGDEDLWKIPVVEESTQRTNTNGSSWSERQNHLSRLLESESRYPEGQEVYLCANSSNGIHPHPNSCGHFLQCMDGKEFVQSCAPGTVFNPKTSVCDWESNVPECTRPRNLTFNNSNRVKRSVPYMDNHIIISDMDSGVSKMSLSRGRRASSRHHRTRKCTSSEEYIQPHSIYCNKFEICSNGRIVEETCGLGAMFNPLALVCDLPDNVDCTSRKVDFSTYGCEKDHKYRASHPENCNKFIECDKGNLHVKTCPPGTVYDSEEELCDHAYKVKCKKPISLEHDTDVNYIPRPSRTSRASRHNSLNLACEYNYIAPHPTICNKFVECEDRRIFIKSCGPGTVFNEEIGVCDWAYNTRKPDPLDCSRYLQCVHGRYTPQPCLRGTVFHRETKKCIFSPYGADFCRQPQVTTTTTKRPVDYESGTPQPS